MMMVIIFRSNVLGYKIEAVLTLICWSFAYLVFAKENVAILEILI